MKKISGLFGPVVNHGEKQNIQLQNFVLVGHHTAPLCPEPRATKLSLLPTDDQMAQQFILMNVSCFVFFTFSLYNAIKHNAT